MNAPLVLILDFDGVVIESNDVKTEAFQKVFSHWPEHYEAMMAFHRANVSLTRFGKFDYLHSLLGESAGPDFFTKIAAEFSITVRSLLRSVPLVPGALEFLPGARQRWPLYLASVTPIEELREILAERGLTGYFRDVYGCPPWTKPDAVRDVLAREGVAANQVLLVGDSAGDQRCARETGVSFVARDSGLNFDVTPEYSFADLFAVAAFLEQIR